MNTNKLCNTVEKLPSDALMFFSFINRARGGAVTSDCWPIADLNALIAERDALRNALRRYFEQTYKDPDAMLARVLELAK